MRKISWMLILLVTAVTHQTLAQSAFSFSCARDTVINSCIASCITIKSRIPDIRSSTSSYVVNPLSGPGGCFRNYVDPGVPGTSTSIDEDDTYSTLITLPFTFPFFGTNFPSLVISTNGYISFDPSLATDDSHWQIGANLPSNTYDRALIMGPYHDLDPGVSNSPSMRINYTVWGSAPNRRWILSFYKVPLFSPACNPLIENTHQIVLYEGLGVVEVIINSKQQCPGWNSGKGIVGMQNFARNAGIMAPNRTATSPPWGSVNMNEAWRFVPASGPTLFRKVELFDLAGNLVSTGDTVSVGAQTFEVIFPNVCPTGTTTYVVRTEYQQFNNPSVRIVGTDTLNVVFSGAIITNTAVSNIQCNGDNNGSIVLNNVSGGTAPYQFSLDGVNYQPSNTFSNLAAGTYTVRIKDATVCTKDTVIIITEPQQLSAGSPAIVNATCTDPGIVTLNPTGGVGPYTYSTDGITFSSSNVLNLVTDNYTLTVQDDNGCTSASNIVVPLTNDLTMDILNGREDTTICRGLSVQLTTTSNATSYSWSPVEGLDDPSTASPVATPDVPTEYTVTGTMGQCTTTDRINVNAVQQLTVSAGTDVSVISGEKVQLNGFAANASGILWTPSTGLSATNIFNPFAKPAETTDYTLTVTNDEGCVSSDIVRVTVVPYCIKIKNAFTPNGDGINDTWQIYDQYDCLRNISLGIFNRYGHTIYETKDYRNNWDGRYKGNPVPDGTYYAVIRFTLVTGSIITIKQDVTVLR
jgi:gliding motility-associated-like protein